MKRNKELRTLICLGLLIGLAGILIPVNLSAEDIQLSSGQTVYVPIYSHIYSGVKGRPFDLAATLSIRNTNLKNPITLVSVKYYDSDGKLVEDYLKNPQQLDALVSTRYIITEADKAGGSGANFMVVWKSDQNVNPPIIEAVMIGTHSGQGISFVSRGQVIKEDR
ncbi:MAG: DUF3124 domain-containing protein [Desulfobacteraceae bacterium]|jgi:hypothetical protein|nr:DUF3124 domain-containing protein [Desulfobacteraceae bacterium]